MQMKKVWSVYFSPCGSVKQIACYIAGRAAEKLGLETATLDYTLPAARERSYSFGEGDIVVWGSPVYAGRLPNKLLPFVQNNFKGNGALAVPVAVFGNRSFDDALAELRNELENNGFRAVAGAGIAARHVFSEKLAAGRPDEADMVKIEEFSAKIADKIKKGEGLGGGLYVRGANPPKEYYTPRGLDGRPAVFLKAKPATDKDKCVRCGLCAASCPMGSISGDDPSEVGGVCIKCHACIHKCPRKAKHFDDEAFLSHKAMLELSFQRRAEPEFFI